MSATCFKLEPIILRRDGRTVKMSDNSGRAIPKINEIKRKSLTFFGLFKNVFRKGVIK